MEIWNDIEDYEGLYQVSNFGNIKSNIRTIVNVNGIKKYYNEIILKPAPNGSGYPTVSLYLDGQKKTHLIHRLVAKSFIINPHNYLEVNHKDENKSNNHVGNLEWCSNAYNQNYGTRGYRIGKKLSKVVEQYTLDNTLVNIWNSTMDAERNGYCSKLISACCLGKRKTHKGYKWKYKEEL